MSLDDVVKLLGATGVIIVALVGAWRTKQNAQAAAKATPYDQMIHRLTDLEASDERKQQRLTKQDERIDHLVQSDRRKGLEIIHLRGEVHTLGEHTVEVHQWIEDGMPPPPPRMSEAVARVVQRLREDLERQHVANPKTD